MSDSDLKQDFIKAFDTLKQDLGFQATLEELDQMSFLLDHIQEVGYISDTLSRTICYRILETFGKWSNYFHGLLVPPNYSLIGMTEAKAVSEEQKKELTVLMNSIMELHSRNSLLGLSKDKVGEAQFIDDCLAFWNNKLKPQAQQVMKDINENWQKEMKNPSTDLFS